jgi:hypothetical protein
MIMSHVSNQIALGAVAIPDYRDRKITTGTMAVALPSALQPTAEIPLVEIFG